MTISDDSSIEAFLRDALRATAVSISEPLQSLWGGQGSIVRISSNSPEHPVAVLKMIRHDPTAAHPRGWNSDASFARKARSYEVECYWYEHYAARCREHCKVPEVLAVQVSDSQRLILLEDLSPRYPQRCAQLDVDQVLVCLTWLANFHAKFMNCSAEGLWQEGTYWHLATRQDEYAAMPDSPIKHAAVALDQRLRSARYQSLVHGDAKVANFCFSENLGSVAAVDFQYVGRGCGIRDVAYLLGSCLSDSDCQNAEELLLNHYFSALREALVSSWSLAECQMIEREWRELYAIAWTDFYRFLLGWMPTHAKINQYTRLVADRALAVL